MKKTFDIVKRFLNKYSKLKSAYTLAEVVVVMLVVAVVVSVSIKITKVKLDNIISYTYYSGYSTLRSVTGQVLADFKKCQVTLEVMEKANKGAILNPCPPFFRGEEVSEDVINSDYFVGYEFKRCLLQVQQAIMIYCLTK